MPLTDERLNDIQLNVERLVQIDKLKSWVIAGLVVLLTLAVALITFLSVTVQTRTETLEEVDECRAVALAEWADGVAQVLDQRAELYDLPNLASRYDRCEEEYG